MRRALRTAEAGEKLALVSTRRGAIGQTRLQVAGREGLARSEHDGESVLADPAAGPHPERAVLLALQRSAGNQAVGRAVQRLREHSAARARNETGLPDGL